MQPARHMPGFTSLGSTPQAYAVINEIYPIGHILSFIFSGRKNLDATTGAVRAIVNRCVTHDLAARYQDVRTIIHDVEGLESGATSATQGAPA